MVHTCFQNDQKIPASIGLYAALMRKQVDLFRKAEAAHNLKSSFFPDIKQHMNTIPAPKHVSPTQGL